MDEATQFFINLETYAGLVTPSWVRTNKATLSDAPQENEEIWRKQTSAILKKIFINLHDIFTIENLLEIGAHEASVSTELLSKVKKNCYALEANVHVFNKFKNLINSEIIYENIAITDVDGWTKINIPGNYETLERPDSSILIRSDNSKFDSIEVESYTLKTYIDRKSINNETNSCWLDAEGLAYEILNSAKDYLQTINILLVEVEDLQYWQNQKLVIDVFNLCLQNELIPICRDLDGKGQYNVLFVRKKLLSQCGGIISDYWKELNALKLQNEKSKNQTNFSTNLKNWLS